MLQSAISDQKRLVRALHWQRARYYLRVRDAVHQRDWRLLIIAGPAPHEEINCIREFMPRAHITAVDISQANIDAAIDAGADDVFLCDIGAFEELHYEYSSKYFPPKQLRDLKFDAVCIDLTGPANDWLRRVVNVYFTEALLARGVLLVTLCYGRDVIEIYDAEWTSAQTSSRYNYDPPYAYLENIPLNLAKRVWYVLRAKSKRLDSCLAYRGNRMPMISCLLVKKDFDRSTRARYATLGPEDYEVALGGDNLGNILAAPQEQLLEIRKRKAAARKAVETKKRQKQQLLLPGVSDFDPEE
jgi:hypothetical protein